jgi:hypothetical protein
VDAVDFPVELLQQRQEGTQVLLLRKGTAAHVAEAEMERAPHAGRPPEWQQEPWQDVISTAHAEHQLHRFCRRIELHFHHSGGDHIEHFGFDDRGEVRRLLFEAGIANERDRHSQGGGYRCLVERRLDGLLAPVCQRVTRAQRGTDVAVNAIGGNAFISGPAITRLEARDPSQARGDVMDEIGREHFSAHDLVEATGALLIHREARRGLQCRVRLVIRECTTIVRGQLRLQRLRDRPTADNGRTDHG